MFYTKGHFLCSSMFSLRAKASVFSLSLPKYNFPECLVKQQWKRNPLVKLILGIFYLD